MKLQKSAIAAALALSLLPCCAASAANPASNSAVTTAVTYTGTEIQFSDSGITSAASDGVEIAGTALTIKESGTYLLSGTCADGSIKVKKGTTGVTLVLNGLTLTSETTAPIICAKSTEVSIVAAANTENTLTDTENNNADDGGAEAENAVIKCKDGSAVTLCGTGTLNVIANGKNGIKSGASTESEGAASLTIRELTLNITAPVNDAVNAEAALNVESGTLTIAAGDDALHCDNAMNIGTESTAGPSITITTCCEGLEGAAVNIYSGDVSIAATDDCINAANPSLSGYSDTLNISGGTIAAYTASGDGFDSNGDITISGGTVTVWTANAADNSPLDADGTVTISGGTVLAAGGSGGMGMNLSAQQPCVTFGSTGGMMGGKGSRMSGQRQPPDMQNFDGQNIEKPDFEGQDFEKPDTQNMPGQDFGGFGSAASLMAENTAFSILDDQGNTLYSGTARCGTSFLLFSSPELSEGDSCTLSVDGTDTTADVQTGTISSGMGGGMGFHGGSRPDNGNFGNGNFPGGMGGQRPDWNFDSNGNGGKSTENAQAK